MASVELSWTRHWKSVEARRRREERKRGNARNNGAEKQLLSPAFPGTNNKLKTPVRESVTLSLSLSLFGEVSETTAAPIGDGGSGEGREEWIDRSLSHLQRLQWGWKADHSLGQVARKCSWGWSIFCLALLSLTFGMDRWFFFFPSRAAVWLSGIWVHLPVFPFETAFSHNKRAFIP